VTTDGPGSRALIAVLLVAAAIVAILPVLIARTRRVQSMRGDLAEVLGECRARYAAAATAADTAVVDVWLPTLHGVRRPGDPTCGPYRRRNMLKAERP
jgi:type II secretory pathway pseudopilin PulG